MYISLLQIWKVLMLQTERHRHMEDLVCVVCLVEANIRILRLLGILRSLRILGAVQEGSLVPQPSKARSVATLLR